MQGWVLRRAISQVNRICGRPHRPRDSDIRDLCSAGGVEWPEPEPCLSGGSTTEFDDDLEEEEWESEMETEDEELEDEVEGPN